MRKFLRILILAGLLTGTCQAATRVALVSTCGGDAGADVLALAEAKLSKQPDIELVERREVERVLQEQKLSVCGLSGYAQALAAGKLLGVEVFAALETFPGEKDALGLVVFDALNGVRLADTAMPAGNLAKVTDSVLAAVIQACAKRQAGPQQAQTICLLTVRNADLPHALDSLCQSVGRLVETYLVDSPGLTILERKRLEQINQERRLLTETNTTGLVPSLTLLELEIARGTNGQGLRATAFLTGPGSAEVVKVRASTPQMSAPDLVNSLVGQLTKTLHALPATRSGDRAREAERFRQEAKLLIDNGQTEPGMQAAEAALALDPDDTKFVGTFVGYLLDGAGKIFETSHENQTEKLKRSLLMAQRALDLIEQASRESHGKVILDESLTGKGIPVFHAYEHSLLFKYLTGSVLKQPGYDDETMALRVAFQQQFLRMLLEVNDRVSQSVSDAAGFQDYSNWLDDFPLKNIEYLVPSADAYTSDSIALLSGWAKLAGKYPLFLQRNFSVNRLLARPTSRTRDGWPQDPIPKERRGLSDADLAQWLAFYDSLDRDSNPLLSVYGAIGRLWAEQQTTSMPVNIVGDRVQAIIRLAEEKIATLNGESTDGVRLLCYQATLDALALLPLSEFGGQVRRQAHGQILEFMLGRREAVSFIIAKAVAAPGYDRDYNSYCNIGDFFSFDNKNQRYQPETDAQVLDRLNHISSLIATQEFRYWGENPLDRRELERQLQEIRNQRAAARAPTPWSAANLFFDPAKHGLRSIKAVLVEHDHVWVVCSGFNQTGASLQLVRIALADGTAQLLGSAKFGVDDGGPRSDPVPDIGLSNGKICVGSNHDGIFIFPIDGGPAEHITMTNGLPSNAVGGITAVDGKVYAGLCEGLDGYYPKQSYLVSYDFATKEVRVLSSSLRKEQQSPLDNGAPFLVNHLRPDPDRHRILFTVSRSDQGGIWQIDLKTGEIHCVLKYGFNAGWVSPILDDHLVLRLNEEGSPSELFSFDLKTDTADAGTPGQRTYRFQPVKGTIVLARTVKTGAPYLMHDGWLWGVAPFSRTSVDGQKQEFFPSVQGLSTALDNSWRCLLEVEDGKKILAGTADSLWLFTVPSKP